MEVRVFWLQDHVTCCLIDHVVLRLHYRWSVGTTNNHSLSLSIFLSIFLSLSISFTVFHYLSVSLVPFSMSLTQIHTLVILSPFNFNFSHSHSHSLSLSPSLSLCSWCNSSYDLQSRDTRANG
eukprot:sb/3475851/